MKEKLIIKNFGPIKNVEFELNLINILIGDQGTGKSTFSKLYTLLYNYAYYDIFDIKVENSHDPNTLKFLKNLELFGVTNYLHDDTEIIFNSPRFNFEFSEGVVKTKHPELYKMMVSELSERLKEHFGFDYIPAERVFVSTLADVLFALNQFGTKLPTLFNRFGNKFSSARKEKVRREYQYLLGADFIHNNGVDSIMMSNGKTLPLSDSSTGIQGTMPLLIVFDSIVEGITPNETISPRSLIVIEEPELNLFPETQKKVIEYIVSKNRENGSYKVRLILNTQSPYILTSLNNLIYAYKVGKNHKSLVEKVIKEKYWINPADISAYMMLPNGKCESIIDKDGLIQAEKIDEVSRKLNSEFDLLQNIELGITI